MPGLMILNPRGAKRRRRRGGGRRRRMTAKQLRYFGPRRHRRAKASRAKGPTVIVATRNPRRRHHRRRLRRFARNPRSMRRRRFRRNPLPFDLDRFMSGAVMPAAIGAAGAIACDFLLANLPLPDTLKQGTALPIVRIALALLGGAAVGEFAGASYGESFAAGAMTVVLYGIAKPYIQAQVPQLQLARYMPLGRYLGARRLRRRRMLRGLYHYQHGAKPLFTGGRPAMLPVTTLKAAMVRPGRPLGYVGPARTLGRYAG